MTSERATDSSQSMGNMVALGALRCSRCDCTSSWPVSLQTKLWHRNSCPSSPPRPCMVSKTTPSQYRSFRSPEKETFASFLRRDPGASYEAFHRVDRSGLKFPMCSQALWLAMSGTGEAKSIVVLQSGVQVGAASLAPGSLTAAWRQNRCVKQIMSSDL